LKTGFTVTLRLHQLQSDRATDNPAAASLNIIAAWLVSGAFASPDAGITPAHSATIILTKEQRDVLCTL
jgi:hypothetical protein